VSDTTNDVDHFSNMTQSLWKLYFTADRAVVLPEVYGIVHLEQV